MDAQGLLSRADAAIAAGRIGEGRAHLLEAVHLHPGFEPALGLLAILDAHRGDWDGARSWAARALAANPGSPDALRALSEADIAAGALDAAEARLTAWLADPATPVLARHHAFGLMGDLLDARDDTAAAFAAYRRSNEELRRLNPAWTPGRVTARLRELKQIAAGLGPMTQAPQRDGGAPARAHVFLLGFMRSGTTLLEQILRGSADVAALEEYEALAEPTRAFMGARPRLDALWRLDEPSAQRFRDAYWTNVRGAGVDPSGKVFIDKHPFNAVKLPIIARLFPAATVIFAVRDPRDVVLSCFRHRLRPSPMTLEMTELGATAAFYDACMDYVETVRPLLPLEIVTHRHEAAVADPRGTIAPLCRAIGLGWNDAMLDVGQRVRRGETISQSASQISRGIERRGVAQWRRYAAELAPVLPILGRWVRRFGYEGG
jgi:tetratricopeptide (TPR) repeat protein